MQNYIRAGDFERVIRIILNVKLREVNNAKYKVLYPLIVVRTVKSIHWSVFFSRNLCDLSQFLFHLGKD